MYYFCSQISEILTTTTTTKPTESIKRLHQGYKFIAGTSLPVYNIGLVISDKVMENTHKWQWVGP